jgi:alpha-beta hydrolase superfamily lysophospholipase
VSGPTTVICSPLGYEQITSHRGIRHLAQGLARAGLPTLRFDYHGTGDSAGSDWDVDRVRAWTESISHAIAEARRLSGVREVALVGVRLGSMLALLHAAGGVEGVSAAVLWGPVVNGKAFVRELRAFEQMITGDDPIPDEVPKGAVAAAGFILTPETVSQLSQLSIQQVTSLPIPRALVVPRDDLPNDGKAADLLSRLGVSVEQRSLAGYAVMMRDAHNTEVPVEAIEGITAWLRTVPAGASARGSEAVPSVLTGIDSAAPLLGVTLPGAARSIEERPFSAAGSRLFGILTTPTSGGVSGRPAIILANPGAVHRVGSNRLYVTLARAWAERGFAVLRLDIGGLGDSPPAPGMEENFTYSSRAVADIGEASAAVRAATGCARIFVAGLCSGAHAAFHAALELEHVEGVALFNPIVFYWKPSDALDVSAWMTYRQFHHYKTGVFETRIWRKLAAGQINMPLVWRTLRDRVRDRGVALRGRTQRALRRLRAGARNSEDVGRDLLRLCRRGTRIFLLFSSGEPGLDFLQLNHPGDLRRLKRSSAFAMHLVHRHGHTFTSIAAQREVLLAATRQLVRWYP